MVMDEALRKEASGVAQQLRKAGRSVDLVLEAKKMKWVFKVCRAFFLCSLPFLYIMLCPACLPSRMPNLLQ